MRAPLLTPLDADGEPCGARQWASVDVGLDDDGLLTTTLSATWRPAPPRAVAVGLEIEGVRIGGAYLDEPLPAWSDALRVSFDVRLEHSDRWIVAAVEGEAA